MLSLFLCALSVIFPLSARDRDLSSLFRDIDAVHAIDEEIEDAFPHHYNCALMGGYFNMPSARMGEVGRIGVGFSRVPPYRNYGVTFQPFSRLEFGINYRIYAGILDPVFGSQGFGEFSDRGANCKFALLQSRDWGVGSSSAFLPEIAVGCEDFYGTKRFYSSYIVSTHSFLRRTLEVSLGWGRGRIKGFFGGVSWMPLRRSQIVGLDRLALIAEWDAYDYLHHLEEHPLGRRYKSRLNVGLSLSFFDALHCNLSSIRGEKVAFSLAYSANLGKTRGLFPKVHDAELYHSPIDAESIGYLRTEKELVQEFCFAFLEQGLRVSRIYLTHDPTGKKVLWVQIINARYRLAGDVKRRVENILFSLMPDNVEAVDIVVEADGLPTHAYRFWKGDLTRFKEGSMGDFEFQFLTSPRPPPSPPNLYEGSLLYSCAKRSWKLTLRPRLLSFFGSATGKFAYNLGVIAGPEGYLFDRVYYKIAASRHLISNTSTIGSRDVLNPSPLINVRSDSVEYYRKGGLSLEQAYVQRGFHGAHGWYGRLACGYFELAYGGVATECLYYPVGQNWAIGLEGAILIKRRYRGLGFTTKARELTRFGSRDVHFVGYQYFLDLYWNFAPLQLDFKVSIGKFLARDIGVRFEIGRRYRSGLRFACWYDWTDARDIVNGSRYRNKGILLGIPLDIFLLKSSRSVVGYALSVWLRDTGVRVDAGKGLYPILYEARERGTPLWRRTS